MEFVVELRKIEEKDKIMENLYVMVALHVTLSSNGYWKKAFANKMCYSRDWNSPNGDPPLAMLNIS